jgi:hypothetical protein
MAYRVHSPVDESEIIGRSSDGRGLKTLSISSSFDDSEPRRGSGGGANRGIGSVSLDVDIEQQGTPTSG